MIRRCLVALLAVWLTVSLAVAQEGTVNYAEWEGLANRAEQAIEADRANDSSLEQLRSDLAAFREQFLAAQAHNEPRIATLDSQIAALGPPPESGDEPAEIAQRRDELNAQLAELRAPRLRAEEAYNRADGLIGEIDATIRARQADELLELGPSPFNVQTWPGALSAAWSSFTSQWHEVREAVNSPAQVSEMRANLPIILALLAVAVLLVWRGPKWAEKAIARLRRYGPRGTGVFSFLLSLGRIVLPVVGLYALVEALFATEMVGVRGTILLNRVPIWGAVLLFIRWLAMQTFSRDESLATLPLNEGRRREGRYYANILAVLLVLRGMLDLAGDYDDYEDHVRAVLEFPILLLCGLMVFRLGQMLVRSGTTPADSADGEADITGFRGTLLKMLGRAAIVVGIGGPVLAAIGYGKVGEALVFPFIATLALAALLLVLLRFINDLFLFLTGRDPVESDSLIPVLAGFVLVLAMAPVLALIWGARVADLTEIWTRFREGFQIGETRISPTDFLTFAIVFVIGYTITRLIQGGLRSSVLPKTKLDVGGQNAIVSGLGYLGIFVAALVAITSAGLDLTSLAFVAGALSVGIGFGLQNIVSNFVSGIILLIERPISEGDWIEAGGYMGYVKDISVRSTRIETFDRTDVIVPNADLISGTVTNYTRGNSIGRVIVPVGVAYGTDTRKVEGILKRIAREHDLVLTNPEPAVIFMGFGADSLDFEIRAILSNVNFMLAVKSDMNHKIAKRFAEEGIEIPFAQRDVWLRNPEVLTGAGQAGADPDAEAGSEGGRDAAPQTAPEVDAPERRQDAHRTEGDIDTPEDHS